MNTDMNGPEISWRFISSRGKTASTFVWISGQATSPLKDFFTSILSEEDCFRIRVREISRKRSGFAYLVTAGVLPLPDFLSPHFFFSRCRSSFCSTGRLLEEVAMVDREQFQIWAVVRSSRKR